MNWEERGMHWCFNYDTGQFEWIDEDGFSLDQGEFVFNWDDSEYQEDEAEEEGSPFDEGEDW